MASENPTCLEATFQSESAGRKMPMPWLWNETVEDLQVAPLFYFERTRNYHRLQSRWAYYQLCAQLIHLQDGVCAAFFESLDAIDLTPDGSNFQ